MTFTYTLPDTRAFLHTLREYLIHTGAADVAGLLLGATCNISPTSNYSHQRWNAYATSITFYVAMEKLPGFTARAKLILDKAIDAVFPQDAGYDLDACKISPLLVAPPDDAEPLQNNALLGTVRVYEHDGLRFRSKTEIKIYDELKRRNVLFFANATAVLGGKNEKRKPDFLVCQAGKWGILEVMGDLFHTGATAMRDHDRARLFKDYGLVLIEFYDAGRCYNAPADVVTDFLQRLAQLPP